MAPSQPPRAEQRRAARRPPLSFPAQAVAEGRWVVMEDVNMAPPDVLAALDMPPTFVLLDRVVSDDLAARRRVALMWTLNPLLLYVIVNSGHR